MNLTRFVVAALPILALSLPVCAADAPASGLTKADVQALVKETLMNDPEIIMQALEKLRTQKAEQAKKNARDALAKNKDALFSNPETPATGAAIADADVTLVEFFDYHCGYCKHFLPELNKVIAEDKKLRVLFIDFPILSEDSATAARAAIAVNRINKDKYFAFHSALMKETGKFDEKVIFDIAKKLGIKTDQLKAEMAKKEISDILDKNRALAGELGINGTPGLVIGSEVVPGALSYDELKGLIANARNPSSTGGPAAVNKQ